MADYWVKNEDGTLLGPLSWNVLKDLAAAGKLARAWAASINGQTFAPLSAFPELAALTRSPQDAAAPALDPGSIRSELRRLQGRPWHEVFGVAQGASHEDFRAAFFAQVKRYHPQRLPRSASAELKAACAEMFKFLSDGILAVQKVSSGAPTAPREAAPVHTFHASEFVGLVEGPDHRLQANVQLGPRSAELFTGHKLANISTCSFFMADKRLPLGQAVDVTVSFEGLPRTLKAHGRVVLESAGDDPRQPKGTGIQLNLSTADRTFLKTFLDDLEPKR